MTALVLSEDGGVCAETLSSCSPNSAQTVFDTGRNWDTLGTNSDRVFNMFWEKSLTKGRRETEGGIRRKRKASAFQSLSLSQPRDTVFLSASTVMH